MSGFYDERRKDRLAGRAADREDRAAERAEVRKDADAERRRKAADQKLAEEKRAKARAARAARVGRWTGWVKANPARAFVRLVQVCSIVPAVISQVGALTDAKVPVLLAALLAAMLEGLAWALVAMGHQAEGERSTRTYRIGAWTAGLVAGVINGLHGWEQYADHQWVAIVLALSSVAAVWLTDLQTHGGRGPTKAEKKAEQGKAEHAKKRAKDHADVLVVAQRLLSATPFGALDPDDAWKVAWHYVQGVEVPGVTADLITGQLQAQARVAEVTLPRTTAPLEPGMPLDPFLDDEDSVYRAWFPEALEAASRPVPQIPESLAGKGLQAPEKAPRKAPADTARTAAERPLDAEHIARVRDLAAVLEGAGQQLSVRRVRELIGCRTEYAVRLRDVVQPKDDDGGQALVGAR